MSTKLVRDLQYRLSNGSWINVDSDRVDEFIGRCTKNNSMDVNGKIIPFVDIRKLTIDEVIGALNSGKELRNHHEDWYSYCRVKPIPIKRAPVKMILCDCGCTVPEGCVMSSCGTSCPDCYDRMEGE